MRSTAKARIKANLCVRWLFVSFFCVPFGCYRRCLCTCLHRSTFFFFFFPFSFIAQCIAFNKNGKEVRARGVLLIIMKTKNVWTNRGLCVLWASIEVTRLALVEYTQYPHTLGTHLFVRQRRRRQKKKKQKRERYKMHAPSAQ